MAGKNTLEELAEILQKHAEILEKMNEIPVRPVWGEKKFYNASAKLGDFPVAPPNPKELAEKLREMARGIERQKVRIHKLDKGEFLIKLSDTHEAQYAGGFLYHGGKISPFASYKDDTVHIVTDFGYIKGTPEGKYWFRPVEKYGGLEGPVIFVRHRDGIYVVGAHGVYKKERPLGEHPL